MGGEASKAALADGFNKLSTTDIDVGDSAFWSTIISCKENPFKLIAPEQVRTLMNEKPENLKTLVQKTLATLEKLSKSKGNWVQTETDKAVACATLLARVIPTLFEDNNNKWANDLFWNPAFNPAPPAKDDEPQPKRGPLAHTLLDVVWTLLFKPGFTCLGAEGGKMYWEGGENGAMGPEDVSKSKAKGHCAAGRAALLKLLLVCSSGTLFVTPEQYKTADNKWIAHLVTKDEDEIELFVSSLFNQIFNYDPVGMGIPYSTSMFGDANEAVVDSALQTLLVCLDYKAPEVKKVAPAKAGAKAGAKVATERVLDTVPTVPGAAKTGNVFRDAIRAISKESDFEMIVRGLCTLLNNPHQANNTLLPSSMKQIACFQELLMVFWKMVDENKNFLSYVLRVGDINDLVVPMLYFMYEGRKDASKIGLIHICTFILLLLSGERNFCVNLNAHFRKRLPVDLPQFDGNHADLLYIVIHKLITDGPAKLDTLFECFLTIMSNVSPYIKTFCMPAAMRLANLFELFANPKRVLYNEAFNRYVVFCLEVFNNVIQYQYEGNPHFLYQIIRRKKVFDDLQSFIEWTVPEDGPPPDAGPHTPTKDWVRGWASKLPMQPCLRLMQHLLPQLEQYCTSANVNDESTVVGFLKTTTLVGLLPVPHPILIRKYQQNEYTNLWFTTYIWGVIYLRNTSPAVFDATRIKLFTISYVDQ